MQIVYGEGKMEFKSSGPVIVFHQEILETEISNTTAGSVLVSQHYWDPDDPTYINENDEVVDNYITSEFSQSKVYGCQVPFFSFSRNLILTTYSHRFY